MADSTQSTYKTIYRDDRQDDFDSDLEGGLDRSTKARERPYRTVQRYRVTPSRAQEVEPKYPHDERQEFKRYELFERSLSATDMRPSSMTDSDFERRPLEYEPEREHTRSVVYERERERSRSRERGPSPTGQWRDSREMYGLNRYEREREYYNRPEMAPKPIIIRERAPEPQQIIAQEAPKPPPLVIPGREDGDEEYYYRRDVRRHSSSSSGKRRRSRSRSRVRDIAGATAGTGAAAIGIDQYKKRKEKMQVKSERERRRGELRRRPSVTASDNEYSDEDYVVRRKIIRRERSRSYSPNHKRHPAEGALADAGAAGLLASYRGERGKGKHNERKGIEAGADTARSGLAGAAVARLYKSKRRRKDAREDRSKSRSRARSIGTYSDPGVDPELGMVQYGCTPVFNHAPAYQQGGGTILGASGAEVFTRARSRHRENQDDRSRSRSRSRSSSPHSKIKTALGLAASGLAAAAAAKYVSNREAIKENRGRSRTRSPPRRRYSNNDYSNYDDRRSRTRSRSNHTDPKNRSVKLAIAGAATASVAGVTELFRDKSHRPWEARSRSRSRIRTSTEIAPARLAGAGIARLFKSRKPKESPPYGIADLVTYDSSTASVSGRGGQGGRRGRLRVESLSLARTNNQTKLKAMKQFADDPNSSSSLPSNTVSSVTDDTTKQSEIPEMVTRNAEASIGSSGQMTIIPSRNLTARERELARSTFETWSRATRAHLGKEEATSKDNIVRAIVPHSSGAGDGTSPNDSESQNPIQDSPDPAANDDMLSKLEAISTCLPSTHPTRQAVTSSWPSNVGPLRQPFQLHYSTHWDLPNFVASCFADLPPSKRRVENIFTITSDNENAQGTSTEAYLKENWPEVSDALLKGLNNFVKQPSDNRSNIIVSMNDIKLDLRKDGNEADQVLVSVEASYILHVSFAAAFSWVCAAFRRTLDEVVCRSVATVVATPQDSKVNEDNTLMKYPGTSIYILLNDLIPVDPSESCWYELFPHYVIASGHPTRPRKQGIGLEIGFVDMLLTSQCLSFITEPSGLVIHGLTSVLIPMAVLPSDDAVQWHFEDKLKQPGFKLAQVSDILALPKFKGRKIIHDLKPELLVTRRCFLGYAAKANIVIGTKDYPIKFDRSQAHTCIGIPRITSPGFLPFGSGAFASSSIFQQGTLSTSSYKSLLRICAASRDQLVLMYDAAQEIGWYLPQTSVILHLVQSHLRFCDYMLYEATSQSTYDYRTTRREMNFYESESGCAGFSSPHSDGHAEALAAIQKSLKLKVKIRNDVESPEDEDFGQILQQFWHLLSHVSAALDSRQTTSPATIKGVDFRDVVTLQNSIDVKEVRVDQPWALLTQIQPLVLMVRNIQPPIIPELENICKTWISIPTGRKYLVTTGSITRSFLERQSNGLGKNLEWEAGRDLIQTHSHKISQPIYHAQRLRIGGKAPPNTSLLLLIDKHPDCCLVFGNSKEQKCSEKVLCDDPKCCPVSRSKPAQLTSRSPTMACKDTKRELQEHFSTAMSLTETLSTVSSEMTSNSLHLTDGISEPETPSPSTPRLLNDTASSKNDENSFTFSTNKLSDIIPGLSSEPIWLQKSEKGHVARNRISRLPRKSGIPVSASKAESRTQQSSNWEVQKP